MSDLSDILEAFLSDDTWTVTSARRLEEMLDQYAEISGVQTLQDILASYEPSGGAYLYDRNALQKAIELLLANTRKQRG